MKKKDRLSLLRLYHQGATQQSLARRFGITQAYVSMLVRRKERRNMQKSVSHLAKLSEEEVKRLRREVTSLKISQRELALRFHISQSSVSNLLHGRTYKGVS
jgi:transcriptional regulator with XRE-family HTH domain